MGYYEIIGIIAFVLAVVQTALPAKVVKTKLSRFIYTLILLTVAMFAGYYFSKLKLMNDISEDARELLAQKYEEFSSSGGFIQAALSFLETHKVVYPGSYERALEICKNYDCQGISEGVEGVYNDSDARSKLSGIIQGIAIMAN